MYDMIKFETMNGYVTKAEVEGDFETLCDELINCVAVAASYTEDTEKFISRFLKTMQIKQNEKAIVARAKAYTTARTQVQSEDFSETPSPKSMRRRLFDAIYRMVDRILDED